MNEILSLRKGFATNSSSLHSIILTEDFIENDSNGEFGWEHFSLTSDQEKRKYLACILYDHLNYIIGNELATELAEHLLKTSIKDAYIDHQSEPTIPMEWDGRSLNMQYFNDYRDFILQERVKIFGGHDNGDDGHPLLYQYSIFNLPLIIDSRHEKLVARKDPIYGNWVVFDRRSGTKARYFLDGNEHPEGITRASIPELIDISITSKCNENCKFCYRDSKPNGTHASFEYLTSLIYYLKSHQVFEVALGGGEPLEHPDFLKIIKHCNNNNIIPNFTTRNLNWLKDDKLRKEILSNIGGFAYSVSNSFDVRKFGFLLNKYDIEFDSSSCSFTRRPSIQIVEGVVNKKEFVNILHECAYHNFSLTILGLKLTGRGKCFKPVDNFDMLDVILSERSKGYLCSIGFDTTMAQKYEGRMENVGINRQLYSLEEGVFSCFIDAVNQEIGPSSFSPDKMIPFLKNEFEILPEIFQTFAGNLVK